MDSTDPANRCSIDPQVVKLHSQILLKNVSSPASGLTTETGMSALHVATLNNFTHTALHLINNGANVNSPDCKDNLPLHYTVKNNNLELVRLLLQSGSKKSTLNKMFESPVHIAVRLGHTEVLRELVDQGSDVNICEPYGNVTPLHIAVNVQDSYRKFQELFEILLDGRCCLNCRAFSTLETPVYRAIDMCKSEIAELLLIHGANPNLACPFDVTSLQKACQRGNRHLVNFLLHCGIDWKKEKWLHKKKMGAIYSGTEIMYDIQEWMSNAPSLQNLCRIKIRSHLEENLQKKINALELPKRLKEFLLMSDLWYHCKVS